MRLLKKTRRSIGAIVCAVTLCAGVVFFAGNAAARAEAVDTANKVIAAANAVSQDSSLTKISSADQLTAEYIEEITGQVRNLISELTKNPSLITTHQEDLVKLIEAADNFAQWVSSKA